jgi:hypothetical protein
MGVWKRPGVMWLGLVVPFLFLAAVPALAGVH